MKSQQQAHLKCKHPCNNSTAKFQYSFAKSQRFTRAHLAQALTTHFYDLPSELTAKTNLFARSKRDLQKQPKTEQAPAPWHYHPKHPPAAKDIKFGPGR